jgi:hypothetical protein
MSNIPFNLFKSSCEERGYTERIYEDRGVLVLYTNNGIKCEIKKSQYTVGWTAKPEYVAEIRKRILEEGFTEKISKRSLARNANICININLDGDILETFWAIVGIIENIEMKT